jgi:hypothetical protein
MCRFYKVHIYNIYIIIICTTLLLHVIILWFSQSPSEQFIKTLHYSCENPLVIGRNSTTHNSWRFLQKWEIPQQFVSLQTTVSEIHRLPPTKQIWIFFPADLWWFPQISPSLLANSLRTGVQIAGSAQSPRLRFFVPIKPQNVLLGVLLGTTKSIKIPFQFFPHLFTRKNHRDSTLCKRNASPIALSRPPRSPLPHVRGWPALRSGPRPPGPSHGSMDWWWKSTGNHGFLAPKYMEILRIFTLILG